MKRRIILQTAIDISCGSREETHGSPQETFDDIALLWSAWLKKTVTAEDVCMMQTLLKMARSRHGTKNKDDYTDGAAYQALAYEVAED